MAPSRERARALIESGRVLVSGSVADKAARLVGAAEPVLVTGPPARFVSRGGDKLAAALDRFGIDATGRRCVDAGASTGGFTDCLLQAGAATVVAVDVGHGQLDPRLRGDARVEVHERTNLRSLAAGDLGPLAGLVVADLSFISLATVAANLVALCELRGDIVVLVKPQFEAGRAEVSKGRGVIRDPGIRVGALEAVAGAFESLGAAIMGGMVSPIRGSSGNVEFLLHLVSGTTAPRGVDLTALGHQEPD